MSGAKPSGFAETTLPLSKVYTRCHRPRVLRERTRSPPQTLLSRGTPPRQQSYIDSRPPASR